MIGRLVVIGLGDVTMRYLVPALAELMQAGELADDFSFVGVGRHDESTEWLRDKAADALRDRSDDDEQSQQLLVGSMTYRRGDATDAESLAAVFDDSGPVVVYLALPPAIFAETIDALVDAGLPEGSRLVVEKPFGTDAESAERLNDLIHRRFDEQDVFRVDHFLGKQTAHNIIAARFANRILEPVWSHADISNVEVVWDETLALEGRAGYYDGTGAAKDMLQNHLLQLMCLVAMEPPDSLDQSCVADRKVEVLRAARPWAQDLASCSVRARYTAGESDGDEVPAYVDEEGVDPDAATETFAEITLAIDTARWRDVPFTLRSGKALAHDCHEIAIHFRRCEHIAFSPDSSGEPNVLRLRVDPDQLAICLRLSVGGGPDEVASRELVHGFPEAPLGPYALLLREALIGDVGYSVRDDEAVESWRVIEPFLEAWAENRVPMLEYPAGSPGPAT
ncbi:MAG TPA: glucose-6-phosphate dehydrogenase [Ilumatobacteraceae bacterium]|nr:glucose-6-phosphate dehydrogenase [Ilumatobacteraceae bacterium]